MSGYEPVVRRAPGGWDIGVRGSDGMVLSGVMGPYLTRRAAAESARAWADRLNRPEPPWEDA